MLVFSGVTHIVGIKKITVLWPASLAAWKLLSLTNKGKLQRILAEVEINMYI